MSETVSGRRYWYAHGGNVLRGFRAMGFGKSVYSESFSIDVFDAELKSLGSYVLRQEVVDGIGNLFSNSATDGRYGRVYIVLSREEYARKYPATLQVFDLASLAVVREQEFSEIRSLEIIPGKQRVYAFFFDPKVLAVRVLDADTGQTVKEIPIAAPARTEVGFERGYDGDFRLVLSAIWQDGNKDLKVALDIEDLDISGQDAAYQRFAGIEARCGGRLDPRWKVYETGLGTYFDTDCRPLEFLAGADEWERNARQSGKQFARALIPGEWVVFDLQMLHVLNTKREIDLAVPLNVEYFRPDPDDVGVLYSISPWAGSADYTRQVAVLRLLEVSLASLAFLREIAKDEYETSAEYGTRLASVSADFETPVELADYDADRERLHARVGGVHGLPISLAIKRSAAGQLKGVTKASLRGVVRGLAEELVRLNDVVLVADPTNQQPVGRVWLQVLD